MKDTTFHVCLTNEDFLQYAERRMFGRQDSKALSQQSRYFCLDTDSPYAEDIMEVVLDRWHGISCSSILGIDERKNNVSEAYGIPKDKLRRYAKTVSVNRIR